jgi:transcriptional regulator with XRE-family HTH domain
MFSGPDGGIKMAADYEPVDLGAALRTVRAAKGWTLAEVKSRTGLSISTLSKLENGKMGLSYDKLMKLGRGLGVDIAELLTDNGKNGAEVAQLLSGRRAITRRGDEHLIESSGFLYKLHSAELLNRSIHPMVVDLKAESLEQFGEFTRHAGEEFTYVLEGTLEFHCDLYAPVRLSDGDSIYFDAGMGHAYLSVPPGSCRILSVCTGISEHI